MKELDLEVYVPRALVSWGRRQEAGFAPARCEKCLQNLVPLSIGVSERWRTRNRKKSHYPWTKDGGQVTFLGSSADDTLTILVSGLPTNRKVTGLLPQ